MPPRRNARRAANNNNNNDNNNPNLAEILAGLIPDIANQVAAAMNNNNRYTYQQSMTCEPMEIRWEERYYKNN
jgi:hypothetical protein